VGDVEYFSGTKLDVPRLKVHVPKRRFWVEFPLRRLGAMGCAVFLQILSTQKTYYDEV
jgi:hypothetical protein